MIQIGDRVKCINNSSFGGNPPKLVLNREYIVYDLYKCSCGLSAIDVGLIGIKNALMHCVCDRDYSNYANSRHFCDVRRFVKSEEQSKTEYKVIKIEIPKEELIMN